MAYDSLVFSIAGAPEAGAVGADCAHTAPAASDSAANMTSKRKGDIPFSVDPEPSACVEDSPSAADSPVRHKTPFGGQRIPCLLPSASLSHRQEPTWLSARSPAPTAAPSARSPSIAPTSSTR